MLGWQAAYAQALNLEKKGNWESAVRIYERLLKHGEEKNAKVLFRLGHALFRMEKLDESIRFLEEAVSHAPERGEWEYRLAFVYERKKDYINAIQHYDRALATEPNQSKWKERRQKCVSAIQAQERNQYRSAFNDVVRSKGTAWERLDMLAAGYESHREDKNWLKDLGLALFTMNRFEDAARIYTEVVTLDPRDADSHFACGWAWQGCGRTVIAEKCFATAVELDSRRDAKTFGVGVFYQSRGQWRLAAEAYIKFLVESPENPELNFRAGVALQKSYEWREAERYLGRAIMLDPTVPLWRYRRGLSFERLGDMEMAASCYADAARASKGSNLYWFYRLGQVRAGLGDYQEACNAYAASYKPKNPVMPKKLVSPDGSEPEYMMGLLSQTLTDALESQSGDLCYSVGRRAEAMGMLPTAEEAYRAAAARLEKHDPNVYYSLGRVLAAQGKWEDGAKAYADVRVFKRAFGIDVTPYLKTDASAKSMTYLEYAETTDVNDEVIVYEASHGVSVSCNPLAIFRHIIDDPRFHGFTHVWVLDDKHRVPKEMWNRGNVIFVARQSDLYLRYLATAKYLVNNNTFPPYFVRRKGQHYLNTWHGTPIKTLGRDIKSGVMDHKNAARNFLQATHMIFPNKFTADCLMQNYDVANIYTGQIAITGYPRNDSTLSISADARDELRKRLGIAEGQRVVLYAPTWRGTLANKNVDESRLTKDLEAFGAGDWHFLYRGHSVDEGSVSGSTTDKYSVPSDIDTNDLLAIVDVLVTDYSSIMFDFMVTGRPIVYYAYDLQEYQVERGLYFSLEDMGGEVCSNLDETLQAITALAYDPKALTNKPSSYVTEFHELENGDSSRRAIEFFFFGNTSDAVTNPSNGRPNALFYAGSFIPNGVTASYLNLVSQLPSDRYNIHTVVDPVTIASDSGRQTKFSSNPDHVHALGRVGIHLVTPEERWVIDKFNNQHNLDSQEMWEIYNRAHQREFVRIFGAAEFDSIICFEGYARFWASVLGNPSIAPRMSSIYLHSVMKEEWTNRFPYLEGVFRLYKHYDRLLSVSKSASEANSRALSKTFNLPTEAFHYVNNLVNAEEIQRSAVEVLDPDIEEWLRPDNKTFVSVGRLSPEKGHLKLLSAFARVIEVCPDARLIVVGAGPMQNRIEALIDELNIGTYVYLAGMRLNPYAIVNRADCFVFSSDYEGQGIAILEALILGKPVISTDVIGARSVLEGGYGLLVENSVEGISHGMTSYLQDNPQFAHFDHETYQKQGLDTFSMHALGESIGETRESALVPTDH